MEMHERIKEIRKNHLNLTQEALGQHLGVSRSVINNMERNVLARPDQKLSLIKLMCKEFNVNEDWILHGTDPMFVQPDAFSLDQFAKERDMNQQDLRILKLYFDWDSQKRHEAIDYFLNGLKEMAADNEDTMTMEELISECPKTLEEMEQMSPSLEAKPKPKRAI